MAVFDCAVSITTLLETSGLKFSKSLSVAMVLVLGTK